MLGRTLAWMTTGIALVAIFTAVMFPFEALHTRLIQELARQTGMTVEVDVRRPYRPLGVEWLGLRLSRGEQFGVTIPRVTGVLSLVDVVDGNPVVRLSIWLDDRAVRPAATATATFADWTFQRVVQVSGMAERVDVPGAVGPPVKSGRANATFHFASGQNPADPLDGELRLDVTDLTVAQITNQGIRVPEWAMNSLRGAVQCRDGICSITEFLGTGPDGSLEASGQLVLGHTPQESRWDVGVTLLCSQALSQRAAAVGGFPLPVGTPLRAKLVGSLMQPRVAL